jgi:hypothetical protein
MTDEPPRIIDSSEVLSYAIVPEDVVFAARSYIFVDGVRLGRVPGIAIVQQLDQERALLMLYLDDDWNSIAAVDGVSVASLKAMAELDYPGIETFWKDLV